VLRNQLAEQREEGVSRAVGKKAADGGSENEVAFKTLFILKESLTIINRPIPTTTSSTATDG
jgi:hypothetical protein